MTNSHLVEESFLVPFDGSTDILIGGNLSEQLHYLASLDKTLQVTLRVLKVASADYL